MVLLNRSARSFVCGWHAIVVTSIAPSSAHKNAKSLCMNWIPLSVRRYVSMPYEMSHWSIKTFETCEAVVLIVRTARISFM